MTHAETHLKALMLRGLDGDGPAYGQMLQALAGYLRAYFGRRLQAVADAEDLVQETLLAIHLKRETWDRDRAFTPWAYGIARYKLLDYLRRGRAGRTTSIDDVGELFDDANPEEPAVRRDVEVLLGKLPARQGRLLRDIKLTGLSMQEAAERHGMTVAAVKVAAHRGLKALNRMVSDEDI